MTESLSDPFDSGFMGVKSEVVLVYCDIFKAGLCIAGRTAGRS